MFLIIGALAGFALLAALILLLYFCLYFSSNASVAVVEPVVNAALEPIVAQKPDPAPAAAPATVGLRPSSPSPSLPVLSPKVTSPTATPLVSRGLAVSVTDTIDDVDPDQIERAKARTKDKRNLPITFEIDNHV